MVPGKQHPILMALAVIDGPYAIGILGGVLGPLVLFVVAALLKGSSKPDLAQGLAACLIRWMGVAWSARMND